MLEFEFNGHKSSEFGVIISRVEENDNLISRSPILGQKNKYRPRENHFGMTYDDNYSFKITLIKNPCQIIHVDTSTQTVKVGTNSNGADIIKRILLFDHGDLIPSIITGERNGRTEKYLNFSNTYHRDVDHNIFSISNETGCFSSNDISKLNAWLTSPQIPMVFKFCNDEYFKEDIEYFVTVTSAETENIGMPCSITFTFTCDSPYGYSSEIVNSYEIRGENQNYSFFNNTDCTSEYIYPLIYINPVENGKINICNKSDNNKTLTLLNVTKNNPFYIDCSKFRIYKEDNNKNKTIIPLSNFGLTPNMYWPRLCYGSNTFSLSGSANIKFIYREPKKVGVFV